MRIINNYITREKFLFEIYTSGVGSFPKLLPVVYGVKGPITDVTMLVALVIAAEKAEILYSNTRKSSDRASYHKEVRWYMCGLERKGKIKGFIGKVGRPKKAAIHFNAAEAIEILSKSR